MYSTELGLKVEYLAMDEIQRLDERLRELAYRASALSYRVAESRATSYAILEPQSMFRGPRGNEYEPRVREWLLAQDEILRSLEELSRLLIGTAEALSSAEVMLKDRLRAEQRSNHDDLVVPTVPRRTPARTATSATEIRWSIYVATVDRPKLDALLAALENVWKTFGLDRIVRVSDPIYLSFFQEWWTEFKSRKAAKALINGLVAAAVELPQATADKTEAEAVATLMAHAKDPSLGNVVLRARDIVLVKLVPDTGGPANMIAVQLTPQQRRRLDENPNWLSDPVLLLPRLNGEGPPALRAPT